MFHRHLFFLGRSIWVDPEAGRVRIAPQRGLFLLMGLGCACVGVSPWLVTRWGPWELALGGWALVGIYGLTAMALLGVAVAPRTRRFEVDLSRGQVRLGARLGLGAARAWPLAEVRFTYGEHPTAMAGITACRASLLLPDGCAVTLLETTREAAELPCVLAEALERTRVERRGGPLAALAMPLTAARGLAPRDIALIAGLFALGPAFLWWYLR